MATRRCSSWTCATTLDVRDNPIGGDGVCGLGQGLEGNDRLETLHLWGCQIGNTGLKNLILSIGGEAKSNKSRLTHLYLCSNHIHGAEGGRQVSLLLQRFASSLKVLHLHHNRLGPGGARAMAPGLIAPTAAPAAAPAKCQLQELGLYSCGLGNDGVDNLIPRGHVNTSLTRLDIGGLNDIDKHEQHDDDAMMSGGGEESVVVALASRCTNLDRLDVDESNVLSLNQRQRLKLLLERKRLCTEAFALGGATFPVLFQAIQEAHGHEHGLSAILAILQNDGEDICFSLPITAQ
jgi:Leucine Rich repeat